MHKPPRENAHEYQHESRNERDDARRQLHLRNLQFTQFEAATDDAGEDQNSTECDEDQLGCHGGLL